MNTQVTVEEKREFIKWLLEEYELKRRDCVWILRWIANKDETLEALEFVDSIADSEKAMVISTVESIGAPFRFYKGNLMTADAEKHLRTFG